MKRFLKPLAVPLQHAALAGRAHLSHAMGRSPRFYGAYPDRSSALARVPAERAKGYNDPSVPDVSFPQMCRREVWDYPIIHWLDHLSQPGTRVLDAGGHMGTKYIAFRDLLPVEQLSWTVYDMPAIVAAGRSRQASGDIPSQIAFVDDISGLPEADILLASGLLQYLDRPFAGLVDALPRSPDHILLNKVALRDGPACFTLERLGDVWVPYQIRNRAAFEQEVAAMGYHILDSWRIHELSHRIPTHPWLGHSESWGFALKRRSTG